MCLILFGWRAHPEQPLVIAANRDEVRSRATLPLHAWTDLPIIAGRDEVAGGTWMGVSAGDPRRVAAVTNVRTGLTPSVDVGVRRSRGALPVDFLSGADSPADYAAALIADAHRYEPVNLLVADADELWWATTWPEPIAARVEPGVHGISNGALDSPWPKVIDGAASFEAVLANDRVGENPEPYLDVLVDRRRAPDATLPHTGVPEEFERALSPIFIDITPSEMPAGPGASAPGAYGTRASTVLRLGDDGSGSITERRFGSDARVVGDVTIAF